MSSYGRKAQADAGQASVLVLIIMIAIIIYVLLLPGPIREDLLNGNDSGGSGGSSSSLTTFLNEKPGTLTVIEENEYSRNLPSVVLQRTTNSKEIKRVNPFYVKSGLFTQKTRSIPFSLDDPSLADNVMLSFDVPSHNGVLYITLNGNIIFEGEVTDYNAEPVRLDSDLLENSNTLEFYAEGVGLAFWRVNDYSIQNLRIIADITDTSGQESTVTFMVPEDIFTNAEQLLIKFNPNCDNPAEGTLRVRLNGVAVFTGIPDCGIINTVEVSPKTGLQADENSLSFMTDQGSYLVDLINVEVDVKDDHSPVYYFEISNSDFERLQQENYYANLTVEFVDSTEWKEGTISINGRQLRIDTQDRIWKRNVEPYLYQGHNAIRIEPASTMDILKLIIKLEKN